MSVVDHDATIAFLRREAATAARDDDGHRAWVVRDALEKLPPEEAAELRTAAVGIRKRPGAPSTSRASATAAAFAGLGVTVPPDDAPGRGSRLMPSTEPTLPTLRRRATT